LELQNSRRLTGPNLFWDHPAAIIDVVIRGIPPNRVVARWESCVRILLDRVGWHQSRITHRIFEGGASLLFSAHIDVLYSACELNELAWAQAVAWFDDEPDPDSDAEITRILRLIEEECNPSLLALQSAARAHGVPFLWDDDECSVGYGSAAQTWPARAAPDPDSIEWSAVRGIPLALVTGTNGKSTTVRLAAAILAAGDLCAGITSTDYIRVGETILDRGDYSGPGGARTLLRDARSQAVVLEVARGGMLRRGLGVEHADAALVTNVAADHLGDYGINSVTEMTDAKFIIRRALGGKATLILNADDRNSVARSHDLSGKQITWITRDPENPLLRGHLSDGGTAWWQDGEWLTRSGPSGMARVIRVGDIPVTMNGAAAHNISNALGAAALCHVLGVSDRAIRTGLGQFRGSPDDNPGRGNWFEKNGVRILLDFAHNEHGMRAIARMVRSMGAKRRIVLMGQAGDRLDKDIGDLVSAAASIKPDRLLVCELPGYERGRAPMETSGVICDKAISAGIQPQLIELFDCPVAGVRSALSRARSGDVLVLLVLTQREKALEMIREFMEK
jgi:UDP-N-acetylmuramyl tripeptide synthase